MMRMRLIVIYFKGSNSSEKDMKDDWWIDKNMKYLLRQQRLVKQSSISVSSRKIIYVMVCVEFEESDFDMSDRNWFMRLYKYLVMFFGFPVVVYTSLKAFTVECTESLHFCS